MTRRTLIPFMLVRHDRAMCLHNAARCWYVGRRGVVHFADDLSWIWLFRWAGAPL